MNQKKLDQMQDFEFAHNYTVNMMDEVLQLIKENGGRSFVLLRSARLAAKTVGPQRLIEILNIIADSDEPWIVVAAHNGNELEVLR